MAKTINRIHSRICTHVRSRFEMIKPEPTLGLFNFRCFENAVEYNRRYPEFKVVEVIYIDGGCPILHYINFNELTNSYHETTLGWRAEHLEYYKIRFVHADDYKHISNEFERSLESWLNEFTNWFERVILRIDRVL